MRMRWFAVKLIGTLTLSLSAGGSIKASPPQDRLKAVPGYSRYQILNQEIANVVKRGAVSASWEDGGKSFLFRKDGKTFRYEITTRTVVESPSGTVESTRRGRSGHIRTLERGRQETSALSPDGTLKAFSRQRNVWLSDPHGVIETALTTDGCAETRIKYGTASWVYGEELDQSTAIWWAPDGKKVAYYRFDESKVADYVLALDQTGLQSKIDAEPYPKAGTANPVADLYVYDLKARKPVKLDVRNGMPPVDDTVGYYVYHVAWSPDGQSLLFHRTNRHQNIMELAAANPDTGVCRAVVREEWPASWVENNPEMRFLKDGQRFLWATQRNGFKNYDLYDLSGKRLNAVTENRFEAASIVRVDEECGVLDYLARDGDNPLKIQLHRVGLDGKKDRRLTDPAFHHDVNVAPDGAHVIDVAETHDIPPSTRLLDSSGNILDTIAESDLSKFKELGLKRLELFTFKAADGETDLYGTLQRPPNFDPNKRYPLLVSIYAGPETKDVTETFSGANIHSWTPETIGKAAVFAELGFLVATLDARSAGGRGKTCLDAIYRKFGRTEVDDLAAGVKSLGERSYVDAARVGIYGTSYGGYASLLGLLRYPEIFQAACASSPVTDFRLYDTIYTERYMRTPEENKDGYDAGSAVKLAENLKGRLLIFFGTADNNVHPSNALQLIQALNRAGKSYEVQVGPDLGHSSIPRDRMLEFFAENLLTDLP